MILFLGASADPADFQPITVPDEYPIDALVPLLPGLWWGEEPPVWVASDSAQMATAASDQFGGLTTYQLNGDGFPVAPAT